MNNINKTARDFALQDIFIMDSEGWRDVDNVGMGYRFNNTTEYSDIAANTHFYPPIAKTHGKR